MTGRPTTYDRALADEILLLIAVDENSLRVACATVGVPPGTFCGWVVDDTDGLSERYARARRIRAHGLFDEMLEIADDRSEDWVEDDDGKRRLDREHVQRSQLRVAARQWALARMLRNEFGDKVELSGKLGIDVSGARDGLAAALGGVDPAPAAEAEAEGGAKPAE